MMRTTSSYLLSLLVFLLLTACPTSVSDDPLYKEAKTVFEESIALHDEVMPNMGQAKARIEDLQQAMNQMNVQAMPIDQARMDGLQSAQKDLQEAYSGMMDWMNQIVPVPVTAPKAAEMAKLLEKQKAQRDRMTEIRDQMNSGLARATELIGQ